jgi:hypothetical protein
VQYEEVRSMPNVFVIEPGHERLECLGRLEATLSEFEIVTREPRGDRAGPVHRPRLVGRW